MATLAPSPSFYEARLDALWSLGLIFGFVFGGAMIGIALQRKLPEHQRDTHTKETVQLVMGLVATMAALVMSLLIASSHTFFETQQEEVQKLASDVVLLDEALARYGPETGEIRRTLRDDVAAATRRASPDEGVGSATVAAGGASDRKTRLLDQVLALGPTTETQRFSRSKALDLMTMIASTRLLIHEQSTSSIPAPLVWALVTWLTLLFVGFGLFARVNATVLTAIGFGAFSVATAIFLIMDMSHPYRGPIHVSASAIQGALRQLAP